jgi:hypothetical protein
MTTSSEVDEKYDFERELLEKAVAVAATYESTDGAVAVGRAAREFETCMETVQRRHRVRRIDLLSLRLGYLACCLLNAARDISRSSDGGKKRNELNRYRRKRYPEQVQKEVAKGYSYTDACKNVADKFKVSYRTVSKYTVNKSPYKRGRKKQPN